MTAAPPAGSVEPQLSSLTPRAAAALLRERVHPTDVRDFLRTSPGHLVALCSALIAVCLLAGAVAAASIGDRQRSLENILDRTEPFANSAQRLYSSLSIADASAATAFISGGIEPQAVRDRYTQAVGEAAAELAGGAGGNQDFDAPGRRLLTSVATQLPVYTGLVETARANNRLGNPVGAAYLAEASNLMQSKMLPTAEALSKQQTAEVASAQQRYLHPPWWAMALVTIALVALVLAQLYLSSRWRRRINPGFVLASFAMAILFAWIVVAGWLSAHATDRALSDGTEPFEGLSTARIVAQQARADETLKLVRRDTTGVYDTAFDSDIHRLGAILDDLGTDDDVARAADARERWVDSHRRMNSVLAAGDYEGAARTAVGSNDADSMKQYSMLDDSMRAAIDHTRDSVRSNVAHASRVLDALAPGALALSILAAALTILGTVPRLREYR